MSMFDRHTVLYSDEGDREGRALRGYGSAQ